MTKELLNKISSYNIFNNLLPGVVFVFLLQRATSFNLRCGENIITELFIYYFAGMIISRIGSLIVEPVFKKLKLIQFEPYSNYIEASRKDPKIEILSENNNTYRTFIALSIVLIFFKSYEFLERVCPVIVKFRFLLIVVLLLLLFISSYRKQTRRIVSRIKRSLKKVESKQIILRNGKK
jgi:hypothetical protein